jgi:hypothetical protein
MTLLTPAEDRRYVLSEDQLQLLEHGGNDRSLDWELGLAGIGFGFAQDIVGVVVSLNKAVSPVGWDLAGSAICLVAVAASAAKFTEHFRNRKSGNGLASQIRNGEARQMR